jgi:hypothetical protein
MAIGRRVQLTSSVTYWACSQLPGSGRKRSATMLHYDGQEDVKRREGRRTELGGELGYIGEKCNDVRKVLGIRFKRTMFPKTHPLMSRYGVMVLFVIAA